MAFYKTLRDERIYPRGRARPGEAGWIAEFEKYKQIPEYKEINLGMTLAGFKAIFFWEWLHRIPSFCIWISLTLPLNWLRTLMA